MKEIIDTYSEVQKNRLNGINPAKCQVYPPGKETRFHTKDWEIIKHAGNTAMNENYKMPNCWPELLNDDLIGHRAYWHAGGAESFEPIDLR